MKIKTKRDCVRAEQLIGAEDITANTIAEAHDLLESEERSKREVLEQRLGSAKTLLEIWDVFNETPSGSEIENKAFRKLYEGARTQEARWAILKVSSSYAETKFQIVRDIIKNSKTKDELIKIYRENSLNELGEEAIRKLCEIL